MQVYIVVNEIKSGERNVLGVFTEPDTAKYKLGVYAAENPDEECWIEPFDTDMWQYDTGKEYQMIHRTRVHKTNGMQSHVIVFSKDELPLVEEEADWFVICQPNNSFDKEDGLRKNLQVLKEYMVSK